MFKIAKEAEAQISLDLDWLDENKAGRDAVKPAMDEIAELLKGDAATFNAKENASKVYGEGLECRKQGDAAFSKGEFAEAGRLMEQAKAKFALAVDDARAFVIKTTLESAKTYLEDSKWNDCIAECDKVLSRDASNAEAQSLKTDAEIRLVPAAEIAIIVDGRALDGGETVKIGDTSWTTPIKWDKGNIEKGKTYGGKVAYEHGGRRYFGALAEFTVNWSGPTNMTVALTEYKGPRNGECRTFTLPGGVKMEMVYVAPGSFTMGSSSGGSDEMPHQVRITRPYWIGKYPVTQSQWKALVRANGVSFSNGEPTPYFSQEGDGSDRGIGMDTSDFPMESISWDDCDALVKALNRNRGTADEHVYLIPTEAQWEFVAKGGKDSHGYTYSGGNDMGELGWYYENSGLRRLSDSDWKAGNLEPKKCRTHSVKEKNVGNELGVVGMSGNVWEWCYDWYDKDYYASSLTNDPQGPSSGNLRVLRGGGWLSLARDCRSASRVGGYPGYRLINYGFRLCCSAGARE